MQELEINNVKYKIVPEHGTIILFCERANLEYWEFIELFTKIDPEKISLRFIKGLAELIQCMIERGKNESIPDVYEVCDWLGDLENLITVQKIVFGSLTKNGKATKKGSSE